MTHPHRSTTTAPPSWTAERAVLETHPDALVVRTSLIYAGAEPGPTERMVLDALAGRADVAFFEDELRSPVARGDLAAALLELAGLPQRGVLHLAGPEPVSRLEFARLIAARHGADPTRLRAGPQRRPGGAAAARLRARLVPGLPAAAIAGAGGTCGAHAPCTTPRSRLSSRGHRRAHPVSRTRARRHGADVRARRADHAGAAVAGGGDGRPGASDSVRAGLSALADLRGEQLRAQSPATTRWSSSRTA